MSINKGSIATFNAFTGEKQGLQIVQRHSSVSRAEVSEQNRKAEIAIAARKNELLQSKAEPTTSLVHPVTSVNLAAKQTVMEFVQSTEWQPVEAYEQTIDNARYLYIVVSKMFPDSKAKTGSRKWFGLVTVSDKRVVRFIGDGGQTTLTDIKARLLTLNAIRVESNASEIGCFNVRQQAKPVIVLKPADLPDPTKKTDAPKVLREFVIFTSFVDSTGKRVYEFWDGKDQFIDDIDLARTYTKIAAYNTSKAISKVLQVTCKHLHISNVAMLLDPSLAALKEQAARVIAEKSADLVQLQDNMIATSTGFDDVAPVAPEPVVEVAPVAPEPEPEPEPVVEVITVAPVVDIAPVAPVIKTAKRGKKTA
jgi:hypothetical protein